MIQILYAPDHTDRGLALSGAVPGSQCSLVSVAASAKPGLDTLTFWGHGDITRMCGLLASEFVTVVRNWAAVNPALKTVEIITCNARHASTDFDAYCTNVVNGLRSGFLSSTRNLVVKGMPMNVGGPMNAFSILLAHAPNRSWCYVTGPGPDDKIMIQGSKLVKAESAKRGYDLAVAADAVAKAEKDRKFTVNYGYFNTLRSHLTVVR